MNLSSSLVRHGTQHGEKFGSDAQHRWLTWGKKIITWVFLLGVVVLMGVYAGEVDWDDVLQALKNYSPGAMLAAIGLVVLSYLIYGVYDLIGSAYCGHKLARHQVMLV